MCDVKTCIECGLHSRSLTTECPGYDSKDKLELVANCKMDYRAGEWRRGIQSRYAVREEDMLNNEINFLHVLFLEYDFISNYLYWIEHFKFIMELNITDSKNEKFVRELIHKIQDDFKCSLTNVIRDGGIN